MAEPPPWVHVPFCRSPIPPAASTVTTFVAVAGATELLFGLLVISGAFPQVAVLVAMVPFNATLLLFGQTEMVGHLPVYGVMLALLVYGSSRRYADVVPAWPRLSRRALSERTAARA